MTKKSSKPAATSPILTLLDTLRTALLGREREAEIITIALIAREHALLVGPPGTGKSELCRSVSQLVRDVRYCERLLSPTTPPEAIWGPISLGALREDRYEHITAGYAADAHLLYLDEVGRASPAILDSMLHLLGPERQALIGTVNVKSPLVSAIGSANTWPEDAAMLDRWTLRATVHPLGSGMRRSLLMWQNPKLTAVATLADLDAAHQLSRKITVAASTYETLDVIFGDLDEAGIAFSDRRLRSVDRIMRAACVARGGSEVEPIDLEVLQYVLWTTPDQSAVAAAKIVARANPIGARLDSFLSEVDEVVRAAVDAPKRLEAAQKLTSILAETKKINADPKANGRAKKVLAFVQRENVRLNG